MVYNDNIQAVLIGLQEFAEESKKVGRFGAEEMKKFMEPIFAQNGYRAAKTKGQRSILILASAALGDFVCMSAMIREMRRLYETAHITLVVWENLLEIAEFCPHIDELVGQSTDYDKNNFAAVYEENFRLAEKLLIRRYDVAYYFPFTYASDAGLTAYMAGARKIICPNLVMGGLHAVCLPFCREVVTANQVKSQHRVDNCLSVLDCALGAPVLHRQLEFWTAPQDLPTVRAMLPRRRYIALCVGGSGVNKHYPAEKYALVVKRILAEEDADFIVLGGPKDTGDAERLKEVLGDTPRVRYFVGTLKLRQTGAMLSLCDYCLTNDTSLAHIAAAMGVPTVDIFPCAVDTMQKLESMGIIPAVRACYPAGVPAVIVQAEHALPGCLENPQLFHGCKGGGEEAHCIAQIEPETVVNAFHLLKNLAAKNICEPCYYSGGSMAELRNTD